MLDPNSSDLTPPTILVMMPCYGGKIFLETVESLLELQREGIENGIDILYHFDSRCSLISQGRSIMTCNAFEHLEGWTHMLWVDADVGFTMEDVWKLLISDKDIVGGMYPLKSFPIRWCSVPYPTFNGEFEMDKKLVRTHYIANGFMMVKRETIAKMLDHYKEELDFRYWTGRFTDLFQPIINKDQDNLYLTEDYAFCKRANDMGLETWVRNDVKLSHTGVQRFSEKDQQELFDRINATLRASSMAKHTDDE
jgi:hypothetical protein|tara:strand:- start:11137 stop:11892 length:756 start_codon:yes stop_codon:yes gene_type:complete